MDTENIEILSDTKPVVVKEIGRKWREAKVFID